MSRRDTAKVEAEPADVLVASGKIVETEIMRDVSLPAVSAVERFEVLTGITVGPNGTTSHHSMSSTVLPDPVTFETNALDSPPNVNDPSMAVYLELADGEADDEVVVDDVSDGGEVRARAKTGYGRLEFVNKDSRMGGR
jgi:hypothetical protein